MDGAGISDWVECVQGLMIAWLCSRELKVSYVRAGEMPRVELMLTGVDVICWIGAVRSVLVTQVSVSMGCWLFGSRELAPIVGRKRQRQRGDHEPGGRV